LMFALTSQKLDPESAPEILLLLYSPDSYREAIREASSLRAQGKKVELMCKAPDTPDEIYETYAKNHQIKEIDKRYV
ncbi:MAG: hypothetical protein J6P60_02745, partial [Lachnospiraceae bacterium]|nr:hypothetical protein [Lachnospiraceae bacterium]